MFKTLQGEASMEKMVKMLLRIASDEPRLYGMLPHGVLN